MYYLRWFIANAFIKAAMFAAPRGPSRDAYADAIDAVTGRIETAVSEAAND